MAFSSLDNSWVNILQQVYVATKQQTPSLATKEQIDKLPDAIRENIFWQIWDLSERPSEENYGKIHVLDDLDRLGKAVEIVASQHFPQLDFSKKLSPCRRLLNIYETAKNGQQLSEITRFELSLLPEKISQKIFLQIWELNKNSPIPNFGEIHVLDNPKNLEIAIEKTVIEMLIDSQNHSDSLFFEIDEKDLIDLAKLCAQRDASVTAEHIKNFGIQDQKALIDIAQLCAQLNVWGVTEHIKNFGIQDQNALIDIAQLCASQDSWTTALEIQNFGIQDQKALIDIAKLCASQDSYATAEHIKNFGIQDPKDLIDIAKLCAQQSGRGTAENIQKFGIQDQKALIEIAKLCASQDGRGTAAYIQYFGIQDPNVLIDIAKLCALQSGGGTAEYIKEFGIQDPNVLIDIAKLCALQSGGGTARHIQNFGIQDPIAFQFILLLCVLSSPDAIQVLPLQNLPQESPLKKGLIALLEPLKSIKKDNPSVEELKNFLLETIQNNIGPHPLFLEQIKECLAKVNDPHALVQISKWIASILFFLKILDLEKQERMIKTELLKNLFHIPSPVLRQNISSLLVTFAFNPAAFNMYLEQSPSKQAPEKKILDFLLVGLQNADGAEKELKVRESLRTTTDRVKTLIAPSFGKGVDFLPLLEMLYLLNQTTLLSAKQKELVLQSLYEGAAKDPKEKSSQYQQRIAKLKPLLRQRVFALLTILLFKNEALLEDLSRFEGRSPLIECAKITFQEKLHLDAEGDSFIQFQKLFMTQRNPNALITYAGKLFSINDPAVIHDLGRYVNSVIHDSFLQERYQPETNPHLQKIAENTPAILETWKSPLETLSITFSSKEESLFDPRSWLLNKVEHGHMNPNNLPHLKALLNQEAVNEDDLLPIEKALKGFLEAQNKQLQISQLELIGQELLHLTDCQFRTDVSDQLQILKRKTSNLSKEVKVVDTDHYLDLLLCGTEVLNSCQNVNGQPNYNKGLLGYLLDGKNRLIAVKNKEGRIMARAKLSILLNDKEMPVLFLETIYDQGKFSQQCMKAIVNQALLKARSLGIPLIVAKDSQYCNLKDVQTAPFERTLISHGGGVSNEYVNACRGVKKDGIFEITSLFELIPLIN